MSRRCGPMKVTLKKSEPDLAIQVSGKWILAGEHSVLRGGEALVFPLKSRYLKLNYFKTENDFDISLNNESHPELELIIWSVLEKAMNKLNLKRRNLKGLLSFESKILFGAGMGASATLCVSLTRLFHHWGFLKNEEMYDFARELENLFHGESSGVDVAVTLNNQPLLFSRHQGYHLLKDYQKPFLYLSHTGERGVTKDCVDKVKKLIQLDPLKAKGIDDQMNESVSEFKKLLAAPEISHGEWIKTLKLAYDCFYEWGLVNEAVKAHEVRLKNFGAMAVKLTGSGGGGFMLSYWEQPPPPDVTFELIPCFNEP